MDMTYEEALDRAITNLKTAERAAEQVYKLEDKAEVRALIGQGWAAVAKELRLGR
jgi:hypothetical protein